jgi:hypothetical protein
MVSPQSENKTRAQNNQCITNYLLNDSIRRKRVYLTAAAAVLFMLIATSKLLAEPMDPTPSIRTVHSIYVERGLLTVTSHYEHPIIIATLRGYNEQQKCHDRYDNEDHGALAKFTLLSDPSSKDGPLLFQVGQSERISSIIKQVNANNTELWKTQFRLHISPPPFTESQLCYTISYRVEYADFEAAMADFPPKLCSFQGRPKYHRVWKSSEFMTGDPTTSAAPGANWLVRKSQDENWEWSGVANFHPSCPSWKHERPYKIVIIGDSQPSYTCNHLVHGLTGDINATQHPKVRCVTIKQTLQNSTTFDRYASELQHSTEDFVIFNPSGLWEAAYGSLNDFRGNFERLLSFLPTERGSSEGNKRRHYFFAPTTAVHPINYPDLQTDDKKWSMTQPRVSAINNIAADLVNEKRRSHEFKSDDTISISSLPAPWDQISLSREDDPMTPTDMRHFNVSTNEMLLTALLCKLDAIWQDGK